MRTYWPSSVLLQRYDDNNEILIALQYYLFFAQDVVRTDRDSLFLTEDGFYRPLLDILVTYTVYDPSFAYTQGMSDMLSPVLVVMGDEVCCY